MSAFCSRSFGSARRSAAWTSGRGLDLLFVHGPCALAGVVLLACLFGASVPAAGDTPESPNVQQMLGRATAYLEAKGGTTDLVGAKCLVGMALLKAGKDQTHPLVQAAVASARKIAPEFAKTGGFGACYNEAIACIFLCEVDPAMYASDIRLLVQGMLNRQRPNGAWSYQPPSYDDTSQTQYGVLCCWAAHHAGVEVPARAVENTAQWLMRVQNTDGGWTYSPLDPKTYERRNQGQSTHSMAAAGLSSVYICAHLLGFGADARRAPAKVEKSGLPPALQKVETEEQKKKRQLYLQPTNTNGQQLFGSAAGGNAWFAKNLTYDTKHWTHYYMYAVERYKSFQELVEGKVVPDPDWYNAGVAHLQKTQAADGFWASEDAPGSGPITDTAFAVLFLTRSSQKSIKKATLDEGILIGGMGLPKDLTNARMQDGKVVTPQMVRDVDDLLQLLGSAEDKDFDATALPGGLSLDADLTKRTSQLERLRALVTNENFEARLAAVKTLAKSRDLDNVPALIFALTDPNPMIVQEAESGLRFISRKFAGFGLPAQPTKAQLDASRLKWRAWYLSIRPDGQLLDY